MSPCVLHARLEAATAAIGDLTLRGVRARRVAVSPVATVIEIDELPPVVGLALKDWMRRAFAPTPYDLPEEPDDE